MTHILDTNAWIEYLRRKNVVLATRMAAHRPADIALGSVVLGELYYGAFHSPPTRVQQNLQLVADLVRDFPGLPFDSGAAEEYGKLREHLTRRGCLIGDNDMLIAATALAHDLTLVTHNTAEFSRVPGLKLEDWQTP